MSDVAWTGGENLMSAQAVHRILETILLCSGGPVSLKALLQVFSEEDAATVPAMTASDLRKHLTDLQQAWEDKGLALVEVAGGWQFQSRPDMQVFLDRLEARRPLRYSRALLETLAIVAWHQPVTRGDIEDIRGVSVSTPIMRTLQDRGWIEVLGHRDAPGRPSLFGTTQQFLNDLGLKALDELPDMASFESASTMPGLASKQNNEDGLTTP